MPVDFSPLNALAAKHGEDNVIAMVQAYVKYVKEKRAGVPPPCWLNIQGRLWRDTLNATVFKLDELNRSIKEAEEAGIPSTDTAYVDALSRLSALTHLKEDMKRTATVM